MHHDEQIGGTNRRDALRILAAAALGTMVDAREARAAHSRQDPPQPAESTDAAERHGRDMNELQLREGSEKIGILLYPGFVSLDAIGPYHVFLNMMGAQVRFIAKSLAPVPCEGKSAVTPHATFADARERLDLLVVPGGMEGTLAAMEDAETIEFLRLHGARDGIVGSVCTGALVLAAAGLLDGYRATSHWISRDVLKCAGATPVNARFVVDRNRITGGGVTAGIDYGLHLVRRWRGDAYAKAVQMFIEYDPQPPFRSGTPEGADADPAMALLLRSAHEPFNQMATAAIGRQFGASRKK
jgi:cyclohexyl-isocyanide hydratase